MNHANKQGLTMESMRFVTYILIYLCLNGKKDHEDGRHTCTKDWAHNQLIYPHVLNFNDVPWFDGMSYKEDFS